MGLTHSPYSCIEKPEADEIFGLIGQFAADPSKNKVNLGIGVYRDNNGRSWPLPVVERVEEQLVANKSASRHDYLALQGDTEFLRLAKNLVFGTNQLSTSPNSPSEAGNARVVSVQTISGTGANHIGAHFLTRAMRPGKVFIPTPTWGNHFPIWSLKGIPIRTYPYFDAARHCFNFEETMATLESQAEEGDVVLLHACAHNPTGSDPTKEQWRAIGDLCDRKRLVPFFDLAYQGFASGDLDEDAWAVRHFVRNYPSLEVFVAQSFSKNFGLYGQRVGALHVVASEASVPYTTEILGCLCGIIRGEYSMAPRGGAEIVRTVLADEDLRAQWLDDLDTMSSRIKEMRHALYSELTRLQTPGSWKHVVEQNGMFSYLGLTEPQVREIRRKYHVYMILSGRISISGLSPSNVEYFAAAVDDVVRNVA